MKIIIAIFFFIIFFIFQTELCSGQIQEKIKINVRQDFGKKEKYIFSVEKYSKYYLLNLYWQPEKFNYMNLGLLIDFVSITEVELDVKKKKNGLYSCTWTYGPTKLSGINEGILDKNLLRSFNLCNGIQIKFNVDRKGRLHEYCNYEEYKSHLLNAYKKLYSSDPYLKDSINEYIEILQPSFKKNENLLETYFEEVPNLFSIFDLNLRSDSNYNSNSIIPDYCRNKFLLASVNTNVDSIIENDAFISVKQTILNFDKDLFTDEINKEMAEYPGIQIFLKPKMYINSVYTYDYKNNIIKEYYREKINESGDIKKIEGVKVILKN